MSTLQRAHSLFEVKSADAERGLIHGWASTPDADAVGDVMEPLGAVFDLPLPLLHEHDRKSPIGHVIAAKPTERGIEITAKVALGVTSRIDEIFALLRAKLITGLSIGFQGLESAPIKGGGRRYAKWRWMELSAVVLPMQSRATIMSVKKADHEVMKRLGMLGNTSTSLATRMKAALADATPERPPPMLMVGAIRYELVVRRDADGKIQSVLLEPISYVQLPREAA